MRLATIQTPLGPRAVLQQGLDLVDPHSADDSLPTTVRGLLTGGPSVLHAAAEAIAEPKASRYSIEGARFLPPIPDPQKIICIGLNYRDHAAETGAAIPREPVVFSKFNTALLGSGANIVLPPVSQEVDYEAELVLVIGKQGRNIKPDVAQTYLAGYTVGHDVSARDWQLKKDGKQWLTGKTFDTFAPTGPMIVSADEVPDPCNLGIRLRINGVTMQDSNTRQMIFPPAALVAYLSQVVTLLPGDLIFTGTPPGVGVARKPPVWLKSGDVVEVEIDGLGVLRNPVMQG
jgi:2-keto-4-pentenoate hydratase/2-oxohepta-3-ene-1,7-dioic acid hydratase in catechol pathway